MELDGAHERSSGSGVVRPRLRSNEEVIMWISLFTIVAALAISFALGAVVLTDLEEEVRS